MPSAQAARIQSGTGNISFSTSVTAITPTGAGVSPNATTSNTTLTLMTPSGGVQLYDSLTQSTAANNNVTLALRNLVAGPNVSITSADGLITISAQNDATDGAVSGAVTAISAASIDLSTANFFTKTISGATTFTFANAPAGRAFQFHLLLTNPGSNVTWPASVKWAGGTAPTGTVSGMDLLEFLTFDGGTTWYGKQVIADAS